MKMIIKEVSDVSQTFDEYDTDVIPRVGEQLMYENFNIIKIIQYICWDFKNKTVYVYVGDR